MSFRAVLFDLDGTLVDSERENAEAMARAIALHLGVTVAQEQKDFVVGHSWTEIHEHLRASLGERLPWSRDELIARAATERAAVIAEQGMTIMPGAVACVRRLAERAPVAIVTGSARIEVDQALGVLGLGAIFRTIVAVEDYARGKPAPDGYLVAAARLAVPPASCLVVEDSRAGIAAARAAGMKVVAVRAGNFLGQDQSAADVIVDTLDDVTSALIDRLASSPGATP